MPEPSLSNTSQRPCTKEHLIAFQHWLGAILNSKTTNRKSIHTQTRGIKQTMERILVHGLRAETRKQIASCSASAGKVYIGNTNFSPLFLWL